MKKYFDPKLVIFAIVGGVLFGISVGLYKIKSSEPEVKPNILVLSFCSLRKDHLGFYGYNKRPTTPNFDRFVKGGSLVLENAFTPLPWVGIFSDFKRILRPRYVQEQGYNPLAANQPGNWFRIPGARLDVPGNQKKNQKRSQKRNQKGNQKRKQKNEFESDEDQNDNDFEKDIKASLANLKTILLTKRDGPFYLVAHIKYAHYPLIDRFNKDAGWDRYLSEAQKARVSSYMEHPENFPSKVPLLILLFNDKKSLLANQRIRAWINVAGKKFDPSQLMGLITNEELLADWKASDGFQDDLDIVDRIYDANLAFLDSLVAEVLDLYADKELKKNTVVMIVGDHGELHMEHDVLTHGTVVYDDALSIPLVIKVPDNSQVMHITEPTYYSDITKIVQGIIKGELSSSHIADQLKVDRGDKAVLIRNCSNTIHGIRFNNKWKYFVDVASGESFLFDLEKDPKEVENVALQNPEIIEKLDAAYWASYKTTAGQKTHVCPTWTSL